MNYPMGNNRKMPVELGPQIIKWLRNHCSYLGFFVVADGEYVGLANCNLNFANFQAKFLVNIHDFTISPENRSLGAGSFLLKAIINYASNNDYCQVNLEVREDNTEAKSLYRKMRFLTVFPE